MIDAIKTKQDLIDASKIGYIYVHLAQGNTITIDNNITTLTLKMSESGRVYAKNNSFADIQPMPYDEMLDLDSLISIISQLKNQPSNMGHRSKWDDITISVGSTLVLNMENKR